MHESCLSEEQKSKEEHPTCQTFFSRLSIIPFREKISLWNSDNVVSIITTTMDAVWLHMSEIT